MKAATCKFCASRHGVDISIHAAREGGDSTAPAAPAANAISIHAAREGGDETKIREARVQLISIHAAREGGDSLLTQVHSRDGYFNPRRP